MYAVRIHDYGGREVLTYEKIERPRVANNELLVKTQSIGVNFIDVYHRTGSYAGELPFVPGMEASGIIEQVGSDVEQFSIGDQVAFAMCSSSYAQYVAVPSWKAVVLPRHITHQIGAASILQGMTAHYLATSTYILSSNDTALIHAAAGGVGLLLVQMAKKLEAKVIGTVSTKAKAEKIISLGADEVIIYSEQDFETEIMKLTNNFGVDVVYDSVGKTTFEKSLNCLRPRGHMVLFGQSSGKVPPVDPQTLNDKGSLFLTRPTLGHYAQTRSEILARAKDIFTWIEQSELEVNIDKVFPLEKVSDAHEYLESRASSGKILLSDAA
ncbi:MAG: NADPH:quinone reductase [Gammaproteobacteria bacterium]|mgnify:CR=1 FL=1|nr:NADPH:quinone reductase [Gammaproteobacteria bacterium]HAJ05854.1 NADPH:quinone reductase [Chloroflexota bacterium]|tara:strand:+ start:2592 stop:3566 length:975 start_codon:yes stop_codon:yes gene_type:complete